MGMVQPVAPRRQLLWLHRKGTGTQSNCSTGNQGVKLCRFATWNAATCGQILEKFRSLMRLSVSVAGHIPPVNADHVIMVVR